LTYTDGAVSTLATAFPLILRGLAHCLEIYLGSLT
jgi:hypothetical protein